MLRLEDLKPDDFSLLLSSSPFFPAYVAVAASLTPAGSLPLPLMSVRLGMLQLQRASAHGG